MKKSLTVLLTVGGIALFAVGALAQQPQQPQRPILVAVVDMPSVIKVHPVTVQEIPIIQQEFQKEVYKAQQYEAECKKKLDEIQQTYRLGTPQFEEAVQPIKNGLRQAQAELQDKQNEVMTKASALQYRVYIDIQKAVQQVAAEKQFVVALTKIKLDRKGVAEEVAAVQEADMNQFLIWNNPLCDITEDVKGALVQIAGTNNAGALSNITGQVPVQASAPLQPQQPAQRTANAPAAGGVSPR